MSTNRCCCNQIHSLKPQRVVVLLTVWGEHEESSNLESHEISHVLI